MITAGDLETQTNHILNVSDLPDTEKIDIGLLSQTGANHLAP